MEGNDGKKPQAEEICGDIRAVRAEIALAVVLGSKTIDIARHVGLLKVYVVLVNTARSILVRQVGQGWIIHFQASEVKGIRLHLQHGPLRLALSCDNFGVQVRAASV